MDRYFFIVNPNAGGGRTAKLFAETAQTLTERGIDFGAAYTTKPFEGGTLARAALAAGEKCIVAVGGDGTVSEVAATLCGTDAVMGILPYGTGNDLVRCIPLSAEPEAALETLLKGRVRRMDMGKVNDRYFINVAGLGFDVDVLVATEKHKQRHKGMIPYLLGIFDALTHLRSLPMRVELDDRVIECGSPIIAIGNGQYFGGGMRVVPMADPFDGLFDVCLVHRVNILQFLWLLPSFISGKYVSNSRVEHFQATKLTVHTGEPCTLDLDGELFSQTPAVFTLLPGALQVIMNEEEKV